VSHEHTHEADLDRVEFTQEYWDDRYSHSGEHHPRGGRPHHLWSGQPNAALVEQVSDLPPGEALDAGCGEGGDAIWLAGRGWTVTAVDVSPVALARAAQHAADTGADVAARITWEQRDLFAWGPEADRYDLATASFLHFPGSALDALVRRMAASVRPGGTLLVIGHHPDDLHAGVGRTGHPGMFPADGQLAALLAAEQWDVQVDASFPRLATNPADGHEATIHDTVLRAIRRH